MKVDLKHILTPNILKKTLKVFYFEAFLVFFSPRYIA